MLSYRHIFHAGNHADVLKHLVLSLVLDYLTQKDKPLVYIDTHAGAGLYKLSSPRAQQNKEFVSGISQLWDLMDSIAELDLYLNAVRSVNPNGNLTVYPGSPAIANAMLRPTDRLHLFELHPEDYTQLSTQFAGQRTPRCLVEQKDGFVGLNAVLPPPERRGLILIDPSYEVKTDYATVVSVLQSAMRKFATGVYLLWYPVVSRSTVQRMETAIKNAKFTSVLQVELAIDAEDQPGLNVSGMFVINPPFRLQEQLQVLLPVLVKSLGQSRSAAYRLVKLV